MHVLFADDFLELTVRDEHTSSDGPVLLSFTGIGHQTGGVDVQQTEFYGAGRSLANVIFIKDLTRSWGNAIDFEQIARLVEPYTKGREVFAIGNSMGGFLAVLASKFMKIDVVVGLVPQFSVSSNVLPKENRWKRYRKHITEYKFESLEGCFVPDTQYYLISGAVGDDAMHWINFPNMPNVHNLVFGNFGHGLAKQLKRAGRLNDLLQDCFAKRFDHREFNKKGRLTVRRVFTEM